MPDATPFHRLLATATPPELGPGPRAGVQTLDALQGAIDDVMARHPLPRPAAPSVRALILLWHDHHEPAHELVQEGATADASYVHAILHRREPDFGNAAYWFRRVGRHAAYDDLAKRVQLLLKDHQESRLTTSLLPDGQWQPLAFNDACEAVAGPADDPARRDLLREIQRVEFEVLLHHLACFAEKPR